MDYGGGFSFNAGTGVTTEASPSTLVLSPTVAACTACHDSSDTIAHVKGNGGTFYGPRGAAMGGPGESCMVCHGPGRSVDIAVAHAKNR